MQVSTGWCARLAVACMSAALVAGGGASTASANFAHTGLEGSAESRSGAFDPNIVTARRALSPVEVRSHEITGSAAASAALTRAESAGDLGPTEGLRIYRFGEQEVMSPSHVHFTAFEGRTAAGSLVYEFAIHAEPRSEPAMAGFAVPPKKKWRYNNDGSFIETVGSWHRRIWWTITKADNWRACRTCARHDYFRIHGKLRASSLEDAEPYEGYKRAWIEFNRGSGSAVRSFEADRPTESIAGSPNQTRTVGFGASFNVNLGYGPVSVGGGINKSYGGSLTRATENWHPIIRSEIGSGGVQWCRYQQAEFTGTKTISTRLSYRTGARAANPPGWAILTGQQDETSDCPTRA